MPETPVRWRLFGAILCLTWFSSLVGQAAEATAKRPVVAGFERFFASPQRTADDRLASGLLLLGELNCTSCHAIGEKAATLLLPKQAPILDLVAERVRPEHLRQYLQNPHEAKPGTTMPQLWQGVELAERQEQVEKLVHFLATGGALRESPPLTPAVQRGEELYHRLGCAACHPARREGAAVLSSSIPLPANLEEKYSVPSLAAFLSNPLTVRPSARMPHLNLSPEEARDIASFLLRNLKVPATLQYRYYEGDWQNLPDFTQLKPKSQGTANALDVNVGRPDHFAVIFQGKFRIAADGNYAFHLASDDGSRLLVDGQPVVDVDGIHPLTTRSGNVALKSGVHELQVHYFEQGGEQELRLEFEGPGTPRQAIEQALIPTDSDANAVSSPPSFQVQPELAAEGRLIFQKTGCAACHRLQREGQLMTNELQAKRLSELAEQNGCLSTTVPARLPHYGLDSMQREALASAIQYLREVESSAASADRAADRPAEQVVQQALTTFNCYACHERQGRGGVEAERNVLFQSNQPEMGDEGRLPPTLTGVAAKLNAPWLAQVLDQGAKARPYMLTRMPRFAASNVATLLTALAVADPPLSSPPVDVAIAARRLKASGRHLAGEGGLSCIKCHTWGDVKATGIQSLDMTTMTTRLQAAWFREYMLDPQRFRPGTRMPAAWPNGQVLLPQVLDGQARTQIHAIWEFLADGKQAAMPVGLGSNPIPLVAYDEPVLYRNFIEGAGPRAIGVGYPEKVNLAFDANDLRLALVWHNAFIDASLHWVGRGPGFQRPLGDNVLALPPGVTFAPLADAQAAWPTQSAKQLGYRFLGYDLDSARRPAFHYQAGPLDVVDHFQPRGKGEFVPLQRTLRLSAADEPTQWYYRAATGQKIVPLQDGWYQVDGNWRTKIESSQAIELRTQSGRDELLVKLKFVSGRCELQQEYAW